MSVLQTEIKTTISPGSIACAVVEYLQREGPSDYRGILDAVSSWGGPGVYDCFDMALKNLVSMKRIRKTTKTSSRFMLVKPRGKKGEVRDE